MRRKSTVFLVWCIIIEGEVDNDSICVCVFLVKSNGLVNSSFTTNSPPESPKENRKRSPPTDLDGKGQEWDDAVISLPNRRNKSTSHGHYSIKHNESSETRSPPEPAKATTAPVRPRRRKETFPQLISTLSSNTSPENAETVIEMDPLHPKVSGKKVLNDYNNDSQGNNNEFADNFSMRGSRVTKNDSRNRGSNSGQKTRSPPDSDTTERLPPSKSAENSSNVDGNVVNVIKGDSEGAGVCGDAVGKTETEEIAGERDGRNVLTVTIHRTDRATGDSCLGRVAVKLTFMDSITGKLLRKEHRS